MPITSPAGLTGATPINFNTLPGGNCNLCGTPVTTQFSGLGVTFDNPSYPGDDTADFNITPYVPGASGNMLYVYQGGIIGDPNAKPFQISFSVPVDAVGFGFASSTDAYLQLSAYGPDGALLETEDFTGSPAPVGLVGYAGLTESSSIAVLDISYLTDAVPTRTLNFSIYNFSFVDPPATPEPSTLILMGAGLLGLGLPAVRKRLRRHS